MMCALEFVCAELKNCLLHVWQAVHGWSRLAPAVSPSPISYELLIAVSGFFHDTDRPLLALAMKVALDGYLCAGELFFSAYARCLLCG